jgi:hypothetical protein
MVEPEITNFRTALINNDYGLNKLTLDPSKGGGSLYFSSETNFAQSICHNS